MPDSYTLTVSATGTSNSNDPKAYGGASASWKNSGGKSIEPKGLDDISSLTIECNIPYKSLSSKELENTIGLIIGLSKSDPPEGIKTPKEGGIHTPETIAVENSQTSETTIFKNASSIAYTSPDGIKRINKWTMDYNEAYVPSPEQEEELYVIFGDPHEDKIKIPVKSRNTHH